MAARRKAKTSEGGQTACTPELLEGVVDLVKKGVDDKVAAGKLGISRQAYETWERRAEQGHEPFAAFVATVARARDEWEAEIASGLTDQFDEEGNRSESAAKWLLERRVPERYGQKIDQRVLDVAAELVLAWLRQGLDQQTFERAARVIASQGRSEERAPAGTDTH